MKKSGIALSLLLLMAISVAMTLPARGQSTQFIIQYADEVNTLSFSTPTSDLSDLINQTAPRFVMRFANTNKYLPLNPLPSALSDLLNDIQPRFAIQFAHANNYLSLIPIPSQLDTLIGQITPRFIFEFAKANRYITLSFPVDLINDTTAPQGSNIVVKPAGETSSTITWTTNEYANSTVRCGIQSGNYTMTFFDPLYVKQHSITLTGLTPGAIYYCVCSSTDLSGNTYQSQEFSFEQVEGSFIYLPLVLRNK